MEDFYRDQRRRFDVLLEADGEPVGGRWNLDTENRERPPSGATTLGAPKPYTPNEDEIDERVRADLDAMAADGRIRPVGEDGPRRFAVTHREAGRALRRFAGERLATFGPYQDAMLLLACRADRVVRHPVRRRVPVGHAGERDRDEPARRRGAVATKPYASGGAYINTMNDYCGDCAFDPRQRVGERACPFTAGYWAWLYERADLLEGNHRMRQPLRNMRRLGDIDAVMAQERARSRF